MRFKERHGGFLIALLLTGCAVGGSRPPSATGTAIKVTCIQYGRDPRTREIRANYWVMLSQSWYDANGNATLEPFARVYRNPFLAEQIHDDTMIRFVEGLFRFGFDRLPDRSPTSIDLALLATLHKDPDSSKVAAHTIINVQWGEYRKTVLMADILGPQYRFVDAEMNRIFTDCLRHVLHFAGGFCVQVRKGPGPSKQWEFDR